MMADELLNVQDLIAAKKHDTFHSEVVTGKAGGLSTGANIDYATNAVTAQVQKTLPKILDDLDWSYVGLFADGVTFTDKTDFAVDADGVQWIYTGSLPFSATAGTVPSEPAYQAVHVKSASAISNANGGSVQDFIDAQKFPNVAEMKAYANHVVGSRTSWNGYYSAGDGGGNTGVVKSGTHVDDGYRIFSISPTLYVEADVNNYNSFNLAKAGLRAGVAYDNKDVFALIPLFKSVEMFDGDYYTTEPWNIPDFTTEKIEGASTENTRIFFDIPAEVFSVTIQSLYVRRTELKRFTIYPKAGSDTNCGLKVGKVGAWGASVLTNDFNVREFSGRVILEDSAFNCTYNNALISGPSSTRVAKILNYESTYEFGNCSTFNNSVINFGKIGIQNKGCSPIIFNSATFESLSLMENTEQVSGLTMTSIKNGCWYENIDYGIVNSKINETTLQPIIPAANKCPIEGYIMNGGVVSSGVTLPVINALLEPYYVNTFSYTRGVVQPFNNLNLRDEFFYTNGLPVADPTVREITQDFDISNVFIINGANKLSNINILVEVLGDGGNAMYARYETSSVPMPVSIDGSIYDPAAIGDGAKITMTRIDATTVRIVARAKGLNYVKVVTTNS